MPPHFKNSQGDVAKCTSYIRYNLFSFRREKSKHIKSKYLRYLKFSKHFLLQKIISETIYDRQKLLATLRGTRNNLTADLIIYRKNSSGTVTLAKGIRLHAVQRLLMLDTNGQYVWSNNAKNQIFLEESKAIAVALRLKAKDIRIAPQSLDLKVQECKKDLTRSLKWANQINEKFAETNQR